MAPRLEPFLSRVVFEARHARHVGVVQDFHIAEEYDESESGTVLGT